MIKTTYSCDRCKMESDKRSGMFSVSVEVSNSGPWINDLLRPMPAMYCAECLQAIGFKIVPRGTKLPEETQRPDLYDVLREIIRDEIREIGL